MNAPQRSLNKGLLLTLLLSLTCQFSSCGERKTFDRAAWQTWVEGEENAFDRYRMAKDLIRRDLAIGLTPAQVRDLLGAPVEEKASFWSYHTGPCEAFPIDYSVLDVTFENGVVVTTELDCH